MHLLSVVFVFMLFVAISYADSPVVSLDVDTYYSAIENNSDIIIKHYTSVCIIVQHDL